VQFLELQKLSNLALDLGSGHSHTGVHIRLRSTHTKLDWNRKNFLRTDVRLDKP